MIMRTIERIEQKREKRSVQSPKWQLHLQETWPHDRRFCVVDWPELHQTRAAPDVLAIHYTGNGVMNDGKFCATFIIIYKEDRDNYHSILTDLNRLAVELPVEL